MLGLPCVAPICESTVWFMATNGEKCARPACCKGVGSPKGALLGESDSGGICATAAAGHLVVEPASHGVQRWLAPYEIWRALDIVLSCLRGSGCLMPMWLSAPCGLLRVRFQTLLLVLTVASVGLAARLLFKQGACACSCIWESN